MESRIFLSAVMHADEINLALTEKHGRLIYYQYHIVALQMVEKQVLWSKRHRDKTLVRTVKEIVQQVNHSRKWKPQQVLNEQGNSAVDNKSGPKLIPSYSILQDEFCRHL